MKKVTHDKGLCVGCPPDMGCIGAESCPMCVDVKLYCDRCGKECGELFKCDTDELCKACTEKYIENFIDDLSFSEKCEIAGASEVDSF